VPRYDTIQSLRGGTTKQSRSWRLLHSAIATYALRARYANAMTGYTYFNKLKLMTNDRHLRELL